MSRRGNCYDCQYPFCRILQKSGRSVFVQPVTRASSFSLRATTDQGLFVPIQIQPKRSTACRQLIAWICGPARKRRPPLN